uniref:BTB domain-containing protein n=1 Tax=Anopheles epiroticus TaxID=199890 RepID=A0A3F2YWI3_9DIPT
MNSVSMIDHSDQVLVNLGELLSSADYSDVTFVIEEDRIQAHRVILASRSEYFRALLYGGLEESKQNEVKLTVESNAFKNLLQYIYTGSLELKDMKLDDVLSLLGLAHQYGIVAFEKAISDYLYGILTPENVCIILDEVRLLDVKDLVEKCYKCLDKAFSIIIKHDSFRNLSFDALSNLLDRDGINIEEIDIFQAVQEWCQHNDEVGGNKKLLFDKIRYNSIPRNSLLSVVRPTGILSPNQLLDVISTQDSNGMFPYRAHSSPGKNLAANAKLDWTETGNDALHKACFDLGERYFLNYVYLTVGEANQARQNNSGCFTSSATRLRERLFVSADGKTWTLVSEGEDTSSYFARQPSVSFTLQPVRYIRFETPFYNSNSDISISAMLNPFQTAQKNRTPRKREP